MADKTKKGKSKQWVIPGGDKINLSEMPSGFLLEDENDPLPLFQFDTLTQKKLDECNKFLSEKTSDLVLITGKLNLSVSIKSAHTLKPGVWINDEVMNYTLLHLFNIFPDLLATVVETDYIFMTNQFFFKVCNNPNEKYDMDLTARRTSLNLIGVPKESY